MQGQPITVYCDDVEPELGLWGYDLRVVGCDGTQGRPLSCIDRNEGPAIALTVATFDLDEDQDRAVEGD